MALAIPQRKDFVPGAERFTARATSFTNPGASADRKRQFLASDDSIDRMGDTIAVDGWDLAPFKLNPVVLYVHNNASIPVGTAEVWSDDTGLHCLVDFDDDPDADLILKKVDRGTLRAVSVGFMPKPGKSEYRNPDEKINDPGGIDFLEQELLEISIVPVPANAHALAEARTKAMATKVRKDGEQEESMGAEHVKALGEHVKTLGEHCKALGGHMAELKKYIQGDDAVSADDKAFTGTLKALGLTDEQIASVCRAADQAHAMHPDVHKCVVAGHKSLTKALNLHNGAAGATPPAAGQNGSSSEGGNGEDEDEDDQKAVAEFAAKTAEFDALITQLTGRVS